MKPAAALLALFALFFTSSCTSLYTDRNPRTDFSTLKRFYVERRLADNHHIDRAIVAELQAMGLEASSGPMTMMPREVDAIITYHDEWAWDFKTYLIQLHLHIRSAHRDQPLGFGTYRQPNPLPKPPDEVIRAILTRLLKHP